MNEYIKREDAIKAIIEHPSKIGIFTAKAIRAIENLPAADVVPKSEVETLQKERDEYKKHVDNDIIYVHRIKAEVARTFRKRMNEKMGKHTHLLGKEYVQRIMREVEKELIGEEDA